jgi:uncharacterized protein (DUF697 family)
MPPEIAAPSPPKNNLYGGLLTYAETMKRALAGGFEGMSEEDKTHLVEETIRASSTRAAVLTLQPVAVVDVALLTPLQRRMVEGIAHIRGRPEMEATNEIFRTLSRQLIGPHLAIASAKLVPLVPLLPGLFAVSVAYALTYSLGEFSDGCFLALSSPPPEEMRTSFKAIYRRRFEITYREKRDEMKAMFRRGSDEG